MGLFKYFFAHCARAKRVDPFEPLVLEFLLVEIFLAAIPSTTTAFTFTTNLSWPQELEIRNVICKSKTTHFGHCFCQRDDV